MHDIKGMCEVHDIKVPVMCELYTPSPETTCKWHTVAFLYMHVYHLLMMDTVVSKPLSNILLQKFREDSYV